MTFGLGTGLYWIRLEIKLTKIKFPKQLCKSRNMHLFITSRIERNIDYRICNKVINLQHKTFDMRKIAFWSLAIL